MTTPNQLLAPQVMRLIVRVYGSFDDAGISREEWDQFVSDTDGDLYVTYDWCRIWCATMAESETFD